jgi:thiosulfate sulfurtransferase
MDSAATKPMNEFKRISTGEAKTLIDSKGANLVDIRDEQSFQQAHIHNAVHLDNTSLQVFIETADPDKPLVVYCYHGNSSQSAAQFLYEKGFEDVYSMDGGFEVWRQQFPIIS